MHFEKEQLANNTQSDIITIQKTKLTTSKTSNYTLIFTDRVVKLRRGPLFYIKHNINLLNSTGHVLNIQQSELTTNGFRIQEHVLI